ncbi:hypothetical protein Hanom_Chr14g01284201 [Helianthus anomalus]
MSTRQHVFTQTVGLKQLKRTKNHLLSQSKLYRSETTRIKYIHEINYSSFKLSMKICLTTYNTKKNFKRPILTSLCDKSICNERQTQNRSKQVKK